MRDPNPKAILLRDYTPPAFLVDSIDLDVDVREKQATIRSRLAVRRNPAAKDPPQALVLDGRHLELVSVAIDGRELAAGDYAVDDDHLKIAETPAAFTLETVVRFDPWANTRLEGFYASKDGLFTQCEAQGFRCITYFIDRPDVMSRYSVTLHAERERFPYLLANGNQVAKGEEGDGRHWAKWEDPFPKPSYLFAMVAAKLDLLEESFTTRSGRKALLQVYVEPGKIDQAGFAMHALKKAMRLSLIHI